MFANDRSFTPASYAKSLSSRKAWVDSGKQQHRQGHNGHSTATTAAAGTNPHASYGSQPAHSPALMGRDAATTQPVRPAPNSSAHRRRVKQRQRGARDNDTQDNRRADRITHISRTNAVAHPTSYAIDIHTRATSQASGILSPAIQRPLRAPAGRERGRIGTQSMPDRRDACASNTPGSAAAGAARVSAAATSRCETRGEGKSECHLCGRGLGRIQHACMDCSAVICGSCVINAADFHPGHTLKPAAAPRGALEQVLPSSRARARCFICQQEPQHERYKCQTCPDDLSLCKNCLDMHPADHVFEVIPCAASDSTGPPADGHDKLFKCFICRQQLSGVRYECTTCSDVNFCEAHREMHPDDHQMATIKCMAPPSAQPGGVGGADDFHGAGGHVAAGGRDGGDSNSDGGPRPASPRRWNARLGKQPAVSNSPPHSDRLDSDRLNRQGDNGDRSYTPSRTSISNSHHHRLPSEVTVTFSRERLLQFARSAYAKAEMAVALAQAVDEAGPSRQGIAHNGPDAGQHVGINSSEEDTGDGHSDDDYDLYKLLDFDLDVALVEVPEERSRGGRKRHADNNEGPPQHRRWSPDEKKQLRALRREGKSDAYIAKELGRTPGAVAQQWRKQC